MIGSQQRAQRSPGPPPSRGYAKQDEPGAATLIEGGLSQEVLGLGGYVLIDKHFYFDFAGYHTVSHDFQRAVGVAADREPLVSEVAPARRLRRHFVAIGDALPYMSGTPRVWHIH